MLQFIVITLNYPLIKYVKSLIYASFHESKHQDFGYFHESRQHNFVNRDKSIFGQFKHIVSHELLNIASSLITRDVGIMLWLNG